MQSRELFLKLLNLDLQSHPPQAAILGVTLTAEAARPQTAQRGLFQAQFPEPDKLDILLARLHSIAGDHNVGVAELCTAIVTMKSRWLHSVKVFTPLARPHRSHHVSHSADQSGPTRPGGVEERNTVTPFLAGRTIEPRRSQRPLAVERLLVGWPNLGGRRMGCRRCAASLRSPSPL